MDYYRCPTCDTANEDYVKYCKRCGTWLIEAKKVVSEKKKKSSPAVAIVWTVTIIVAAVIFVAQLLPSITGDQITFDDIEIEGYFTMSQFVVDTSDPSAAADITMLDDMDHPLRITAVFYDGSGSRQGIAKAQINHQLRTGQTTTVDFDFEPGSKMDDIRNVRVEAVPISPLETIGEFLQMQ